MIGATVAIAILGGLFAAYAGQAAGFLSGLHAAMLFGGSAELVSAAVAFAFIRRNSLQARKPRGE
jgi:hypothetical protein